MAPSFFRQWLNRRDTAPPLPTANQADADDAESQFRLGLKFANGQGAAQDYAQAARWYAQAAEQNHRLAQFNLAQMYAQGQGVLRDKAKSLMWMTKAAELGDAGAQYKLGMQRHRAGRDGQNEVAPEGRIEALKWVRLSAVQGYRGAEGACEFLALGMTLAEVAEGERRAVAFVAGKGP